PLDRGGWVVQVMIIEDDSLVHQDEGRLVRASVRANIINRAADHLAMTKEEKDSFYEHFETQWLQMYQGIMKSQNAGPSQRDAASLLADMLPETKQAAEEMLDSPDLIDRITSDLAPLGIAGETPLGLTLYLVGVSRLLRNPLSARIHGHSASGK